MSKSAREFYVAVGARVRERRVTLGLSEFGLAKRTRCGWREIVVCESGSRQHSSELLVRLATALALPEEDAIDLAGQWLRRATAEVFPAIRLMPPVFQHSDLDC